MGRFTIRPLEVKSLGLKLPMQRKSSSNTQMYQGKVQGEWIERTELIEKKPEFFEAQKPFLNP